ncbi:MAG TPA: VIT domain-containing protein [Bacteroidota bacterium]|nr:VIT domain-containing protein [Bacteroidota bacterium]
MKKHPRVTAFLVVALLLHSPRMFAVNQLTVHDPDVYGSKLGYIDQATLYVEPHGAYVEQTLILDYADHLQFAAGTKIEVVHAFEMPQGAVINDLWLWINNVPVRGKMLATWQAQHIYDSIVSKHRDPAFLSKIGTQYELHVYPLSPGSYRRVKITFVSPTQWIGQNGGAELPIRMLLANNSPAKPLRVYFKTAQNIWGVPTVLELPLLSFQSLADSAGYSYKYVDVADISNLQSLSLQFQTQFQGGASFMSAVDSTDTTAFQLGFVPPQFFSTRSDTTAKKFLVGIDLSGFQNKNYSTLLPNLKSTLISALRTKDQFKIVVTGAGAMQYLGSNWTYGIPDSIDNILERFANSDLGKTIGQSTIPSVIFADPNAVTCWQFPGIDSLCVPRVFSTLGGAIDAITSVPIVAAYNQGFEDANETKSILSNLISRFDSLFLKGGRFLTYYDYNRVGSELLASHYISGLTMNRRTDGSTTLYRNLSGNIGAYFPPSFVHYGFDDLVYTDPDTKVEVQDSSGNVAVISKRINNGLLVVSSIWSFRDDGATKEIIGVPLLGLNAISHSEQMIGLLNEVQSHRLADPFDKALIFSNTDSAFAKTYALSWATTYVSKFSGSVPVFYTVNLLDGTTYTPPSVSDGGVDYYGGGYLLKTVAALTNGIHFETHIDNWNFIAGALSPSSVPVIDSLNIIAATADSAGKVLEMREVNPVQNDPSKPRFFIGAAKGHERLDFAINARFAGDDSIETKKLSYYPVNDTTGSQSLIPALLANEDIKNLLMTPPFDTATIVARAMRYNLLCDFTALLVLDTTIENNPNNSNGTPVNPQHAFPETDTLGLGAYPNPFNNQVAIQIDVRPASKVYLVIYNILGQRVKVLLNNEVVSERRTVFWNGTDEQNRTVSSGVYFVRMIATNLVGGGVKSRLTRILFLK